MASSEKMFMQHDVYSWEINKTDFQYVKDMSKGSKILGGAWPNGWNQ